MINIRRGLNVGLHSYYSFLMSELYGQVGITLSYLPSNAVEWKGVGLLGSNPISVSLPCKSGFVLDFAVSNEAFAKNQRESQAFFGELKGLNIATAN